MVSSIQMLQMILLDILIVIGEEIKMIEEALQDISLCLAQR